MIIDVVTIFPKMFSPVLGESMIKRAQDKGLVKIMFTTFVILRLSRTER